MTLVIVLHQSPQKTLVESFLLSVPGREFSGIQGFDHEAETNQLAAAGADCLKLG